MNFYQKLGGLVLGSRLRRFSEYFLSEVNKVYADNQIPFDASWFSVFYVLSKNQEVSMIDLADTLEISHSAISQLMKNLEQKNLIESYPSEHDGRKRLIRFSEEGTTLQQKVEPIWEAVIKAFDELTQEDSLNAQFLASLQSIENSFEKKALSERINLKLEN